MVCNNNTLDEIRSFTKGYKSMYVSGEKHGNECFLTSGFQAPFAETDLWKQVDTACHFQSYATGGAILHLFTGMELNLNEKLTLIDTITNLPVQYFTVTPTLSICSDCGYKQVGKMTVCHKCNSDDVTFYIRPIGYFRPVLRSKIKEDLSGAEYEFSLRARIKDYSTRKYLFSEDLDELIKEVTTRGM